MQRKSGNIFLVSLLIICLAGVGLNAWVQNEFKKNKKVKKTAVSSAIKSIQKVRTSIRNKARKIVRKTLLDPSRKFSTNIFYVDNIEISRHKVSFDGKVFNQSGEDLDGEVKFFNPDGTYGEEIYRDNKRHGKSLTYYKNGILKSNIFYRYGKMLSHKEYYPDERIRMEVDYRDARMNVKKGENGVGKLYFKNGKVKFEWNLTMSQSRGFKKSYNRLGKLMGEVYYDEGGNVTFQKGH